MMEEKEDAYICSEGDAECCVTPPSCDGDNHTRMLCSVCPAGGMLHG